MHEMSWNKESLLKTRAKWHDLLMPIEGWMSVWNLILICIHVYCYTCCLIRLQHWRCPATDGAEFWISCKRPVFLSSFSCLQVIQNKHPWCSGVAYVTDGLLLTSKVLKFSLTLWIFRVILEGSHFLVNPGLI